MGHLLFSSGTYHANTLTQLEPTTRGVTIATSPRTIHDVGGFPRELFQVQYPAPGDAKLARRVQKLLVPTEVKLDNSWGLDHGTWSVLRHVYPDGDIPVVQLSIDESKPLRSILRLAKSSHPCARTAFSSLTFPDRQQRANASIRDCKRCDFSRAHRERSGICRVCVGTRFLSVDFLASTDWMAS